MSESRGNDFPEETDTGLRKNDWVLFDLLRAGQYDALESEATRVLATDPENASAHFCLLSVFVHRENLKAAKQHLEFLQTSEPNEENTFLAAVAYHQARSSPAKVRKYAGEGLKHYPENSVFYYYAALAETAQLKVKKAQQFLDEALKLDPDDPDYLNLKIRLSSVEETSAASAWQRVEELTDALQHDPHNAALHNTLGDVYLSELDLPKEAEFHYREALIQAPEDRDYQKDLFEAVAQHNLIYRLVSIPSRTFTWLGHVGYAIRHQPWRLIFLLIGFKLVIAFFVWLLVATFLFWPAGKVYEWLLVSELKPGAKTSLTELKLWSSFQRWPMLLRFGLFLVLIGALYSAIFYLWGISVPGGLILLTIACGIHFGFVLLSWIRKSFNRRSGKKQREKMTGESS